MSKRDKKDTTNYLDLDAVSPEVDVGLKFKGKEHKMVPATLDDFIHNTRQLQEIGSALDPVKEVELVIDMLMRAFPTLKREDLGTIKLDQLKKLVEWVQNIQGGADAEAATQGEGENPPKGE